MPGHTIRLTWWATLSGFASVASVLLFAATGPLEGGPPKPTAAAVQQVSPMPKPIAKPIPRTSFQVLRLGGDLETWDSYASTDTSMQIMSFQWKTNLEPLRDCYWQVALNSGFSGVIANGKIMPLPLPGTQGRFTIDFSPFSSGYPKPVTFFVRVKPTRKLEKGEQVPESTPSAPVKITITAAGSGPQTVFHLPETHLKVVFERIEVVDDSDDLSGGDLTFQLDVNGTAKWVGYSNDKWDTGSTIRLNNMLFIVKNAPASVQIAVRGCDNDNDDSMGGQFLLAGFPGQCGSMPDMASGEYGLGTGVRPGQVKVSPPAPFSVSASGSKLKFVVHGHWELYCDPCR